MDIWGEAVALTLDTLVFGICYRLYHNCKNDISNIQQASAHGINPKLESVLFKDSKKYVVVQGDVKAIGEPIRSINYPSIAGVIQKLSVTDHSITRNASGFWVDRKHTIQESYNVVPFLLISGTYKVQVFDPINAEILDLDTIADRFEPSTLSFADLLVGFFSGVKQRGLQSTEEMLKEGTVITGIGDITIAADGTTHLVPPVDGKPFILSATPLSSLLHRLEDRKTTYRAFTILFGITGLILGGLLFRKWYKITSRRRKEKESRKTLDLIRKERLQTNRDTDIPDEQRCVVCRTNPKEMVILPCGHVCLCADCSDNIHDNCPICRATIEQKNIIFIS